LEAQSRFFHWRSDEFETPSLGPVRLSDDEMHAKSGFDQLLQCGDGEARRAAKDEIERLSHCGMK
jgi:hypothetical protein